MNPKRGVGGAAALASGGTIASSIGSATLAPTVAPIERRNVRRGNVFRVRNIIQLPQPDASGTVDS